MKPPPFDYLAPSSLEEALAFLERWGEEAKPLAGGQSLVPLLNFRLVRPRCLIDLNPLTELAYIREQGGELVIGSMTRHHQVEGDDLVRRCCPLLSEAIALVGHAQVRHRGTLGGSLCHADPAAELLAVVSLLEGKLRLVGPGGERWLGPQEFFAGYLTTALRPTELLVEVRLPRFLPGSGWAFVELSRKRGDFALVAAAALLTLDGDGICRQARLALAGVGPTPVRSQAVEELLSGQRLEGRLLTEAAGLARQGCEPESDLHASASYRRELVQVLAGRALGLAWERAREGGSSWPKGVA